MSKFPDLLAILQATVDDEKIFDMSGVADPAEFRAELREAWRALYHNALYCWAQTFYPESSEIREPDFPGPVMNRRFDALSSCWLESFTTALSRTADRTDLPESNDRDFLYFMLGILAVSWEIYLDLRHGRMDVDMFSPGKVDLPFAELDSTNRSRCRDDARCAGESRGVPAVHRPAAGGALDSAFSGEAVGMVGVARRERAGRPGHGRDVPALAVLLIAVAFVHDRILRKAGVRPAEPPP